MEKHPLPRRTNLKRSKEEEAEQKLIMIAVRGNASNQEFAHIIVL
jgi:hypothetical protein